LKHIKGLDTLRAFAVIFVIITHWGPTYERDQPVGAFLMRLLVPDGGTGVFIFFTLSGFLITSILLAARFDSNETKRFIIIKNFIVRRTLRIFPIYYIFLLALILIFNPPDMKQNLPWFLTYSTNILVYKTNSWHTASHTWTLAIEEQFYLFWPWLILFINEKYLKLLFTAAIITGVVSTYFVLKTKMGPFLVYNCVDSFAIGGFYAYARRNRGHKEIFEKVIKRMVPFLLIFYFFWKIENFILQQEYFIFLKKTVESLLAIWIIILIVNNRSEGVRKNLLENRGLNFIGKISYCIYLIHPYVVNYNGPYKELILSSGLPSFLKDFFIGNGFVYICDLTVLTIICWLSYRLIEQPILSLKKFFKL
jgi:peptidoglycan/LPS O-acetylase OafA/YrhL